MMLTHTTLLTLVALASSSIVKPPSNDGKNFELLILHNNDMHARFEQTSQLSGACTTADREAGKCYGGFPRVAYVVKEARRKAASGEGPPVLYLNAGDTYTGTAWFTIYKWKIAAEFLNALEPDAVSLGNHEFDHGVSGLTPFIRNLTCPVLASNLVLNKVPELENERNLRKSVVFNISGVSIGIVGYLTPETKILALKNNVEYIEEIDAIRDEVQKLKNEGINIIIGLGHSGYLKDLEIAKEVEGLSLVIGGHTNTFLWNGTVPDSEKPLGPYPTYVTQSSGRQVPVVQAYAYTKYLGKLYLVFNKRAELVSADGKPILLDETIPQDPDVLAIVERYKKQILNYTEEVIGNTSVVLDGLSCQHRECNMGNLITDAMVYYYVSNYKGKNHWTDIPIAIIQGGGIRSSIDHTDTPAPVTKGDLISVLPFEGIVVVVTMSGKILLQMLEHSIRNLSDLDYPGEFLQVSGIQVVYDMRKPGGSRVVMAEARCWNCTVPVYKKILNKEMYNVIMPNFVSNGGDGYKMLEGLPTRPLNYSELTCTMYYIQHHSPVLPEVEGRVKILKQVASSGFSIVSDPLILFLSIFLISYNYMYLSSEIKTLRESLGNHEFDEEVDGVVPFIRNLTCPVLAANLVLDDVPELKMEPNLYKSTVITINNVKIGIIGYLTPDTSFLAPKNNVKYEEEVQAIKKEVQTLKEQGIEILIALGHSGFLKDLEIAEKVEDLDLVIGGHSNTFLINKNTTEIPEFSQGPYPTIVRQKSGRNVPVVQAYAYTKYLGSLHLVFDNNGEIIHFDGDPILLNNNVPEDAKLLEIVNRYKVNIDRTNNEVVGSSLKFLDGDSCRIKECNLGNLINDAVITYTKKIYKQHSNANIAITVGGRIRTSLYHPGKSFNITKGDLITVVPFSDTLCIMTINGSALLDALEHSVASWRVIDTPGQFLQMSGMDVTYDFANKVGSRVIRARAICANCTELTDIRKENEYKVITPRFLAEGGDGYTMFVSQPREILPFNEVDCVFDYLSNHSPIEPVVSDRIVILNEDKLKNLNITNIIPNSKTGSLPRALVPSRSSSFQHNVTLFLFFCILVFLI